MNDPESIYFNKINRTIRLLLNPAQDKPEQYVIGKKRVFIPLIIITPKIMKYFQQLSAIQVYKFAGVSYLCYVD